MGPFEGVGSLKDEPFRDPFHSLLLILLLGSPVRIMRSHAVDLSSVWKCKLFISSWMILSTTIELLATQVQLCNPFC